jgi:hypothetical protein
MGASGSRSSKALGRTSTVGKETRMNRSTRETCRDTISKNTGANRKAT